MPAGTMNICKNHLLFKTMDVDTHRHTFSEVCMYIVVPVHTKVYGGGRHIAPLILTFTLDEGEWSASGPQQLYPLKRAPSSTSTD